MVEFVARTLALKALKIRKAALIHETLGQVQVEAVETDH
jgi:hypothetical protein